MPTVIHQRVEAARCGENDTVICRVRSGWVVMGDTQHLAGYCVLLPDPVVADLNALPPEEAGETRSRFLLDMVGIGDAILELTDAVRINYEILGNLEPALHAHIIPRYSDEPEDVATKPVWFYDKASRDAVPFDRQRDEPFMQQLHELLRSRGIAE